MSHAPESVLVLLASGDPDAGAQWAGHLEACGECREALENWREIHAAGMDADWTDEDVAGGPPAVGRAARVSDGWHPVDGWDDEEGFALLEGDLRGMAPLEQAAFGARVLEDLETRCGRPTGPDRARAGSMAVDQGSRHARLGQYDRAQAWYERALWWAEDAAGAESESARWRARFSLALLMEKADRFDDAERALEELARHAPKGQGARAALFAAQLALRRGQPTKGLDLLGKWMTTNDVPAGSLLKAQITETYGRVMVDLGELEEAPMFFEQAQEVYKMLNLPTEVARCNWHRLLSLEDHRPGHVDAASFRAAAGDLEQAGMFGHAYLAASLWCAGSAPGSADEEQARASLDRLAAEGGTSLQAFLADHPVPELRSAQWKAWSVQLRRFLAGAA